MRWVAKLSVIVWLAALSCGPQAKPPRLGLPPALHLQIVEAEAQRHAGVKVLRDLLRVAEREVRGRAVLGLGRIGSREAVEALREGNPISIQAGSGPGGYFDETIALAIAGDESQRGQIRVAYEGAKSAKRRATALWALARLGGAAELPLMADGLGAPEPEVRVAAALGLGVLGRREVALNAALKKQLAALAKNSDRATRYAVGYALAREHGGNGAPALYGLAKDPDPEIRALAVFGCVRRGIGDLALFETALHDSDWRVRVEAARGMSSVDASPAMRAALARWLVAVAPQLSGDRPDVHPALEAVTRLSAFVESQEVQRAVEAAYAAIAPGPPSGLGALHCAAAAARVRAGAPLEDLVKCGGGESGWPVHLRRTLLAAFIKDGTTGVLEQRLDLLASLARDSDPRVRAEAIGAGLVAEDDEIRARADQLAQGVLRNESHLVVVGKVAEVISTTGMELSPGLTAALLARAQREHRGDAELRLALVEALRASGIEKARDFLQSAANDANITLRTTARDALRSIFPGQKPLLPADKDLPPPARPPVEVAEVLGREILWELTTTKGEIVIELWPDIAPWNVATIVELTARGGYDGTLFHRAVPNFVVQGGDPTGSGWGGPGFVTPGEPSTIPFDRGVVGIADAGKDTGGSQFFIMHSRAPHLEGRYTAVGRVLEGMEVADALIAGDHIIRSRIDR